MTKRLRKPSVQNKNKRAKPSITFHRLDWLEWISIGFGLWFLFIPDPYEILFTILLIIPIVGLILNGINGRPSIASLVEITKDKDGSNDYDVADFIDFPAIIIMIRVLKDFEFESLYSLLIPGTITFVSVLIIVFTTHKIIAESNKSKTYIYTYLIFNISLYSYAGTYGLNCVYDNSEPVVYETKVLDKTISRGKRNTTYYIKVAPWGHHYDSEKISVPFEQYQSLTIGEMIDIDLKKGLFDIPWYYVKKRE